MPQYILLVMTDEQVDSLSTGFMDDGYHVICTTADALALEMHRHYRPVLTIIDTTLRQINPVPLCQQMRLQSSDDAILCLVNGRNAGDQAEKLLDVGVDDCYLLPLRLPLLWKRANNLLKVARSTRHIHQRLLDWMVDAAFICDAHGQLIASNERMNRVTGYRNDELPYVKLHDLFIVEDGALDVSQNNNRWGSLEALTENGTYEGEWILGRKNMTTLPVSLSIKPIDAGYYIGMLHDLSEHHQVRLTLQESEHKYRDLFDTATDAILIIDQATGRFLNVNQVAAQWLGYTPDEMLSMRLDEIDVPINETQHERVKHVLSTKGQLVYEQFYRKRNGELLPVEVNGKVIYYEGRRAFLCFVRDMTSRREMEAAERTQRLLSDALITTVTTLNSNLDIDGIFSQMLKLISEVIPSDAANIMRIEHHSAIIVDQHGYDKFGLAEEWAGAVLTLPEATFLHEMRYHKQPVYIPNVKEEPRWFPREQSQWILSYLGAPIIVDNEVIGFLNLDSATANQFNAGHARTLMAFANHASIALRNAHLFQKAQRYADELEQRVLERTSALSHANQVLQQEVTERKRIEQTLDEERNLLRTIIDTLPDHIYVKDREGRYLLMNKSMQSRVNPTGKSPISDVDTLPKHLINLVHQEEEALYAQGMPLLNHESLYFNSDGSQRWMVVSKVPLYDPESGEIVGIVGVNRDITDLRGAEEQLSYVVTGANCMLWSAIVEHHQDGGFTWDFHISSEAAARRLLPLDESGNKNYAEALAQSIHPEDAIRRTEASNIAMLHHYNGYSHEYRVTRIDGEVRWLHEEVRVRVISVNRWSLIAVCTDVTERKQAAETLTDAYQQLEQRVQERTAELSDTNRVLQEHLWERRRAEKALRESEAQFRALVEHAPEAIVVFDVITERFININENAARLFGVSRQELLMHGPTDFSPMYQPDGTESVQLMRQKIRDAVNGETPVFEWIYENVTGRIVPCEVRLLLLPTSGTVLIRGSITDISERFQIRQAEQEQRMLADALRDATTDLTSTLELDSVLERMLKHIVRVMPPHESASIMLIEPEDDENVRVLRYQTINSAYSHAPYPTMRFADVPSWWHMYQTGDPIVLSDTRKSNEWGILFERSKNLLSYVAAPIIAENVVIGFVNLGSKTPNTFNNQHAQRLMTFANQLGIALQNAHLYEALQVYAHELEKRVEARTAELSMERTRLRAILDAMTEGVIYVDQRSEMLYTNRSLMHLMGYEEGQAVPIRLPMSPTVYSDADRAEIEAELGLSLNHHGIWRGNLRVIRNDGVEFDGSLVTTRVDNEEGELIGTVTVLRDVSQEMHLEQQKKRFIAVASHELRTPLTNLKTRLYLIRHQPDRLETHLKVMETVTDRMRHLVEDLFDLARFEHGTMPLNPQITALQPLILDVFNVQEPEAVLAQVTMTHELPDEPLYCYIDSPRFVQVMMNLISNAINHTPAGGRITLKAEGKGQDVVLIVEDTGVGIPDTWQDQIFKPFFRGSEQSSGTGLGLSITREIIELHGGRIEVKSTLGCGTSFLVWLKRAPMPDSPPVTVIEGTTPNKNGE